MAKKEINKKEIEVNKKKVMNSLGYKLGKRLLSIPVVVLYIIATLFSIAGGYFGKMNSAIYASLSVTFDGFMNKLVLVSLLVTAASYGVNTFAKAARLNVINETYLKYFKIALKSKIADINKLAPERIHGTVSNITIMKADIKSTVIDIVRAIVPFTVICYNVAKINFYATAIMIAIMTIVIIMNLCSDYLFHFDSNKSKMKADMQGVSTALFMSIPMLKYMNAEAWAADKLQNAQNEATPAMQNMPKQFYNIIVELLSIMPEIICMGNAIRTGDTNLALYCGFNISSIYWMMNLLRGMAEEKSELDGELNTVAKLKGNDVEYRCKKHFPDKLILRNLRFYYESDEGKKKPFIFENIAFRKGKWYRFTAPSGAGKSSIFKYFAGEMICDQGQPDFRTYYVHQQACLINLTTLRENITLGNPYVPDGDITALLEDMGMGQWLRNLPKGLDSIVGVDVTPSGGESSRISLMRAFIHVRNYTDALKRERNTTDLIMMDEVTSALDKRTCWLADDEYCTEEKVIKVCEREFRGCTVAVISHEDETSSALGFRNIVDYEVTIEVRQNGDKEEHIIKAPIAVNHQKRRNESLRKTV
jgi:ABC-type transport system involved in cytochrome bd biosynthesis fused ATPase/permease subunit